MWVASNESAGFHHKDVDTFRGCGCLGCLSEGLAVVPSVAPFSFADLTWGTYGSKWERTEGGWEGERDGWVEKKRRKRRNCVRSRDSHSTISHSFHHLVYHLCYLATFQIDCTRLLLLSALSPCSHRTDDKCRLGLIGSKLKIQAHYLENIQVLSCKPLTAMSFKSEGPCESCE